MFALIANLDTNWRTAVPSKVRLALTLKFLVSGDRYMSLQYLFKISHQLISITVYEICEALIPVLKEEVKVTKNSVYYVLLI